LDFLSDNRFNRALVGQRALVGDEYETAVHSRLGPVEIALDLHQTARVIRSMTGGEVGQNGAVGVRPVLIATPLLEIRAFPRVSQ